MFTYLNLSVIKSIKFNMKTTNFETSAENIKCFVRIRPLNKCEIECGASCLSVLENNNINLLSNPPLLPDSLVINSTKFQGKQYTYDWVANELISQEHVYQVLAKPMLESFFEGFNCTLFTYGQTGAGKTYTMMGPLASLLELENEHINVTNVMDNLGDLKDQGLLPRILNEIFENYYNDEKYTYIRMNCSCLEIYNENIIDLLSTEQNKKEEEINTQNNNTTNLTRQPLKKKTFSNNSNLNSFSLNTNLITQQKPKTLQDEEVEEIIKSLKVKEDPKKGMYVENLTEEEIKDCKSALNLIIKGLKNRHVAATKMNSESSRSHMIYTLTVNACIKDDKQDKNIYSRFHLIDLAGSERQKSTKAVGERIKEAGMINKSLSTLGTVINALVEISEGKKGVKYVPFRDSKLTYLLKDSLGGNSKTVICANISQSIIQLPETISTLNFVQRAKMIKNTVSANTQDKRNQDKLVKDLQEEILRLREKNSSNEKKIKELEVMKDLFNSSNKSNKSNLLTSINNNEENGNNSDYFTIKRELDELKDELKNKDVLIESLEFLSKDQELKINDLNKIVDDQESELYLLELDLASTKKDLEKYEKNGVSNNVSRKISGSEKSEDSNSNSANNEIIANNNSNVSNFNLNINNSRNFNNKKIYSSGNNNNEKYLENITEDIENELQDTVENNNINMNKLSIVKNNDDDNYDKETNTNNISLNDFNIIYNTPTKSKTSNKSLNNNSMNSNNLNKKKNIEEQFNSKLRESLLKEQNNSAFNNTMSSMNSSFNLNNNNNLNNTSNNRNSHIALRQSLLFSPKISLEGVSLTKENYEILKLKNKVEEKESEIAKIEESLTKLKEKNYELEEEIQTLKEENNKQQFNLKNNNEEISLLEERIIIIKKIFNDKLLLLDKNVASFEEDFDSNFLLLNENLNVLEEDFFSITEKFITKIKLISELWLVSIKSNEELKLKYSELSCLYDSSKKKNDELDNEVFLLNEDIAILNNKIKSHEINIAEINKENTKLVLENTELLDIINKLTSKEKEININLKNSLEEILELKTIQTELNKEKNELLIKIKEANNNNEKLSLSSVALNKDYIELKLYTEDLAKENRDLLSSNEDLKLKCDDLFTFMIKIKKETYKSFNILHRNENDENIENNTTNYYYNDIDLIKDQIKKNIDSLNNKVSVIEDNKLNIKQCLNDLFSIIKIKKIEFIVDKTFSFKFLPPNKIQNEIVSSDCFSYAENKVKKFNNKELYVSKDNDITIIQNYKCFDFTSLIKESQNNDRITITNNKCSNDRLRNKNKLVKQSNISLLILNHIAKTKSFNSKDLMSSYTELTILSVKELNVNINLRGKRVSIAPESQRNQSNKNLLNINNLESTPHSKSINFNISPKEESRYFRANSNTLNVNSVNSNNNTKIPMRSQKKSRTSDSKSGIINDNEKNIEINTNVKLKLKKTPKNLSMNTLQTVINCNHNSNNNNNQSNYNNLTNNLPGLNTSTYTIFNQSNINTILLKAPNIQIIELREENDHLKTMINIFKQEMKTKHKDDSLLNKRISMLMLIKEENYKLKLELIKLRNKFEENEFKLKETSKLINKINTSAINEVTNNHELKKYQTLYVEIITEILGENYNRNKTNKNNSIKDKTIKKNNHSNTSTLLDVSAHIEVIEIIKELKIIKDFFSGIEKQVNYINESNMNATSFNDNIIYNAKTPLKNSNKKSTNVNNSIISSKYGSGKKTQCINFNDMSAKNNNIKIKFNSNTNSSIENKGNADNKNKRKNNILLSDNNDTNIAHDHINEIDYEKRLNINLNDIATPTHINTNLSNNHANTNNEIKVKKKLTLNNNSNNFRIINLNNANNKNTHKQPLSKASTAKLLRSISRDKDLYVNTIIKNQNITNKLNTCNNNTSKSINFNSSIYNNIKNNTRNECTFTPTINNKSRKINEYLEQHNFNYNSINFNYDNDKYKPLEEEYFVSQNENKNFDIVRNSMHNDYVSPRKPRKDQNLKDNNVLSSFRKLKEVEYFLQYDNDFNFNGDEKSEIKFSSYEQAQKVLFNKFYKKK